ncbi:MAG: hypothetical protein GY696_18675 [Gammaproteobacteria bacterium]|nr:hypothetical protein [Gammaproteobacteria bacterium]
MAKAEAGTAIWTLIRRTVPYQTNDYDCGVFVCNYMKCLIHNIFPCYSQSFMTYFRLYMARELMAGCCFPCPMSVARESTKQQYALKQIAVMPRV